MMTNKVIILFPKNTLEPESKMKIYVEVIVCIIIFNNLKGPRKISAYRPIVKSNCRFQIPAVIEEFKSVANPGMKIQPKSILDSFIIFITELHKIRIYL